MLVPASAAPGVEPVQEVAPAAVEVPELAPVLVVALGWVPVVEVVAVEPGSVPAAEQVQALARARGAEWGPAPAAVSG